MGKGRSGRMLVLVRKLQQGIWIEGDIKIQILAIERDRVKLGILAPQDVKVMRQELLGDDGDPPAAAVGADAPSNGVGHQ